jgi:O-antigen ligase
LLGLRYASLAEVVARGWLLAAVASAVMGLLQFNGLAHYVAPFVNTSATGEVFANLRQRNQFASLMNIGLLAWLWLRQTGRWPAGRVGAWVGGGVVALLVAANALSVSRTGFFQMLAVGALAVLWGRPRAAQGPYLETTKRVDGQSAARGVRAVFWLLVPVYLGVTLLLATGVVSQAGPDIFSRLTEGAPLCASRLTLWSNVLHLIAQKPWFGWGWGELDHAHFITLYAGERFCDILDNAHNLPLHLAVELGVPAALLFCTGLLWGLIRARPWAETEATRQLAWGVLAMIGLHSLLEYPLWYGPFQMALGLCLVLLWRGRAVSGWRMGAAILVLTGVALASWDYWRASQIYLPPEQRAPAYQSDTLAQVRHAWLFRDQVRFAELSITPLTRDNALWTHQTATALLHYSPEPKVIEKVIESAVMLGYDDEALAYLARYRAAFPKEHAAWTDGNARTLERAPGLIQPLQ